jgi:hypothetical protein
MNKRIDAEHVPQKAKTVSRPKKRKKAPARRNGSIKIGTTISDKEKALLKVLLEIRNGNFDERMPVGEEGVYGKICDTVNEIISINQQQVQEFTRASEVIGRQGKLTQRIELSGARGAWSKGVSALNSLISNLVQPTIGIAHVISSVAKGNLSQKMAMEIGDHKLRGEFAKIAKEVNERRPTGWRWPSWLAGGTSSAESLRQPRAWIPPMPTTWGCWPP